jgi:uncharacterized protein
MVAATQPQHLKAATLSGLIDDLYRAIVSPGGVSNYGFPLIWTGGIRTAYDVGGGLLPGLVRAQRPEDSPNRQQQCALNTAGKSRTVTNDAVLQGLADTDNDWYRARSLITYVDKIKVPVHIVGAYQDEQSGPRGQAHLFERIGGVPKRLMLTNGDHNTESTADYGVPDIRNDRKAWLDQWVRGVNGGFGSLEQARSSVSVLFETHKEKQVDEKTQAEKEVLVPNGRKDAKTFPLPDTTWTDWYLHGDGSLTTTAPTAAEPSQPYVTGTKRQFWSYQAGGDLGPPLTTAAGPDELSYRSDPVPTDTAVAGPITATLFVQSTAPDTELFVELVDEAPDGSRTYLQRGVLRASHRAVDDSQSDHTPDGRIYRPQRPHTNPTNITPGQTYEYLVEGGRSGMCSGRGTASRSGCTPRRSSTASMRTFRAARPESTPFSRDPKRRRGSCCPWSRSPACSSAHRCRAARRKPCAASRSPADPTRVRLASAPWTSRSARRGTTRPRMSSRSAARRSRARRNR